LHRPLTPQTHPPPPNPTPKGYRHYGFNRGEHNGQEGIWYREWAPAAKALALIGEFNAWEPKVGFLGGVLAPALGYRAAGAGERGPRRRAAPLPLAMFPQPPHPSRPARAPPSPPRPPQDNHWAVKNGFGVWELFLPDGPDGKSAIPHK
jgi:hypothetical protein